MMPNIPGTGALHLIKLCVGITEPGALKHWQTQRAAENNGKIQHITRSFPRRAEEVLRGGSLYWVMGGIIRARQQICTFEAFRGNDDIARCAIVLHPELILTEPVPRRAFQGWRYLSAKDAPKDQSRIAEEELPAALAQSLAKFGVI